MTETDSSWQADHSSWQADSWQADWRTALDCLDAAINDGPGYDQDLANAVRALVRLRNTLIGDNRTAPSPATAGRLHTVNAVISVTCGGEYPLVGTHSERVAEACEALRRLG